MAAQAFMEAGKKAKSSIAKSKLSKIHGKIKTMTSELREQLILQEGTIPPLHHAGQNTTNSEQNALETKPDEDRVRQKHSQKPEITKKIYLGHKKKSSRPKSAPAKQTKKGTLLNQNRSPVFDHRKDSFRKQLRPRTPGALVFTINEDGGYTKEESSDGPDTS